MSGRLKTINIAHRLALIFDPGLCQLCGRGIAPGNGFCPDCSAALRMVDHPCSLCGLVNHGPGAVCPACLHQPPRWQRMVAPLVYRDQARELIQRLKYQRQKSLARALVTRTLDYFWTDRIDVLLPVPMHPGRHVERGFNQAQEIARRLARELGIPLDRRLLQRNRPTAPQSGLTPAQRRENLRAAFSCRPVGPYRRVAVVDDIITSGATMDAICVQLQRAGVEHIEAWALARTLKHGQSEAR